MWRPIYEREEVSLEIADRPGRVGQLIIVSIPAIQHQEELVWEDLPNDVWVPIYRYFQDRTERKLRKVIQILASHGFIPYPVEEFGEPATLSEQIEQLDKELKQRYQHSQESETTNDRGPVRVDAQGGMTMKGIWDIIQWGFDHGKTT